jgi:hypothetical protein
MRHPAGKKDGMIKTPKSIVSKIADPLEFSPPWLET